MTARLLSKQGPGEEAEQAWRALIQCNPDNTGYYYGFFSSKSIELSVFYQAFRLVTLHQPAILIRRRSCDRYRPSRCATLVARPFETESSHHHP
jgi:hypothetical protein